MPDLSAVIITKNEEANIARCLDSIKFADELILVDSESIDRTVEIAKSYGARIIHHTWNGYGPAKREGVNAATCRWVLSLDADEALSPELADEIKEVITAEKEYAGYYLKRKTMFLGRWIYHCGWYPDYVLRLFLKSKGNFNDALIHEEVILDEPAGHLKGEILHYCYRDLEQYFEKSNRYTTLGAEDAYNKGKRAVLTDFILKPPASFIKHYIIKQGFRDGLEGFILSVLSAQAVFTKYAKLRKYPRTNSDSGN
jgi:glycosyltransferase involved in cell wall biosynthesis